ncbi:MAG: hypothetical protein ACLRWQ_07845 [Flavonifractor plautii]
MELQLGEEQAELTLPAGQELAEVRDRMDAVGLSNCAVTAFRSRIPQLPAAWAIPERLDTLELPGHPADGAGGPGTAEAGQVLRRCWRCRPPPAWREAMALTERLDAYTLDRSAASPEDVARGELRSAVGDEQAALLCRYLNLYGYGEALIQQYGGELTEYGLLTRADEQPVQEPLPPQPKLGGMEMR